LRRTKNRCHSIRGRSNNCPHPQAKKNDHKIHLPRLNRFGLHRAHLYTRKRIYDKSSTIPTKSLPFVLPVHGGAEFAQPTGPTKAAIDEGVAAQAARRELQTLTNSRGHQAAQRTGTIFPRPDTLYGPGPSELGRRHVCPMGEKHPVRDSSGALGMGRSEIISAVPRVAKIVGRRDRQ